METDLFSCEGCGSEHDIDVAVIYSYFDDEGRQSMYFCPKCAAEGKER